MRATTNLARGPDEPMILIDPLRLYPRGPHGHREWCHMMTDDLRVSGLAELHAMAHAIGVRREFFQWHPRLPHYDLTPARRRLALVHGAVEVPARELVRRCRRDGIIR
ncbi:MAG: DUF4031 domain-containing protein [Chloroflexota bacterium]